MERSPKSLRSGLWSTAMVRFGQPRTKCRALSRAVTTANGLPSTDAYRDSAEWVNLLPISVILQPCGQQKRVEPVHVQCFWNSQKPTPDLDQSVARQVGFDLSKILIPCSISFTIVACDSLKACSKAGVQEKVDPALRRGGTVP